MFVPLSTTAVGTLRNEQMGNASGLFNLLRNIGGSIGISVVDTLIARRQQVHRSELAAIFRPAPWCTTRCFGFKPTCRCTRARSLRSCVPYALLQNALDQQSVLYSYVDDFRYMVAGLRPVPADCVLCCSR